MSTRMEPDITTRLLRVDLRKGVAYYEIISTVPSTVWLVTYIDSIIARSIISTIVTALRIKYYLPDGKLYTVVRKPTRILLRVDTVESLLGTRIRIVRTSKPPSGVKHFVPAPLPQPQQPPAERIVEVPERRRPILPAPIESTQPPTIPGRIGGIINLRRIRPHRLPL